MQPRNDGKIITAHIVAHSHCDPGWLVTAEAYYEHAVAKIIPNVIQYLSKDVTKRFVWAETFVFNIFKEVGLFIIGLVHFYKCGTRETMKR